MAKVSFYSGILLLALLALPVLPQSDAGGSIKQREKALKAHLNEFVGVKEEGGANRGWLPDNANRLVGVPVGSFWCASFAYFAYHTAPPCYTAVRNAYVPAWGVKNTGLITTHDRRWVTPAGYKPFLKPGCFFTIYFASKKRDAHIGIVYEVAKDSLSFTTIEGNASNGLSRNGDGVYKNTRRSNTVSKCLCPPEALTTEEFERWFLKKPYKLRK